MRRIKSLQMEASRLYTPLPHLVEFHKSDVKWRLVEGANRSGKTLAGIVELRRAMTGTDPYKKYAPSGGNILVVGLDEDHVGMMWRKLTEPGGFWLIPDEQTGELRSVRWKPGKPTELDDYDHAYREKWVEAPPLLSKRYIARVAYADAGKKIPRLVMTAQGVRSLWRSSRGKPPQGEHYSFAMIDESIANDDFYYEIARGIVDFGNVKYKSKAVWTATPQAVNPQIWELHQAAESGNPDVKAFQALIENNPYITAEERQRFFNSLSVEERYTRYYGRHAISTWRVYPQYDPMQMHGCEPFAIPPNWTRYLVVDPGTRRCASLFAAVDPDEAHVWVYDGFVIPNAGPDAWARELDRRADGEFLIWIIDRSCGQTRTVGAEHSVAENYWRAAAARQLAPIRKGNLNGFVPSGNKVAAREAALKHLLWVRESGPFAGTPRLKVMRGRVPDLDRQIMAACIDPRHTNQRIKCEDDLLDCVEYLAEYNPGFTRVTTDPLTRESEAIWNEFSKIYSGPTSQCILDAPGIEMRE